MDKEQWNLLWTGEQAFWKTVPHLMAAGHRTAEALTEPRKFDTGRPYKIPQLMAAQEGERTQLMRSWCREASEGLMKGRGGSPSGGLIWWIGGRRKLAAPDWE